MRDNAKRFSALRVRAMTLRHLYLMRSSIPRMLEMAYWPMMQMLTWGFMQNYLARPGENGRPMIAAGALIGAVLLWDILIRAQQGFSFSFLEELWSRNLANLLMSPLRPAEFIASMIVMSLVRLTVGMTPVAIMAALFFGFNILSLGLAFAAFFAVLAIFAWSVGLFVSGMLLRFGLGAENLVWSIIFIVQPLGCVYYPVAILPAWLQPICWLLPPTYVFEGLRAVLLDHRLRVDLLAQGFAIDAVLFALAAFAYARLLDSARRAGSLMQTGE